MNTSERSVEEIVEEFEKLFGEKYREYTMVRQCEWLTKTLQAERQKREEMVEAERERIVSLIEKKINVREYKLRKYNEPLSVETITIPADYEQTFNLARTVTIKDILQALTNPNNNK